MTRLERLVGEFIRDHEGCTSIMVAESLKPHTTSPQTYGYQRPTSTAISNLRKMKLIRDVYKRCPCCNRALTRHMRNVPLQLTADGLLLFGYPKLF